MKYKDFKTMSMEEMKSINGGHAYSMVCTCGANTIVCGYNTNEGGHNCANMAKNYCESHNGGSYMDCTGGATNPQ